MSDTEPLKPALQPPPPEEPETVELAFDTSASPEEMPTSTQASALASAGQDQPGGLTALVSRIRESSTHLMQTAKPWSDFLDRTAFSKPTSAGDVTTRIQKNLHLYRTNYFIFFLGTMALSFLTQPRALMWTGGLLVAWIYLFLIRTAPLVIGGREYSEREKLIGMSVLSFIVVFFLSPVGTTALYGATLSACIIGVHAAFREPDDLFLDDPGPAHLFASPNMNSMFAGISGQQANAGAIV
jgi:PRA1 family protein 1